MRVYIILAVALCVGTSVLAQNTKGTGAENKTTTTTNPVGTSIKPAPAASQGQEKAPDEPIDKGNPSATRKSQDLGDRNKGLFSK
jgi:hypothetical protein